MHVLWFNDTAERIGGCERYIEETVRFLYARHGVRSSLLFRDVEAPVDDRFASAFTESGGGVFPAVQMDRQIAALSPDLIYVHRSSKIEMLRSLATFAHSHRIPLVRFFHDYQLFCPREHKYTTFGKRTCERAVGASCYWCLGFVRRSDSFPGVTLRTIGSLVDEQRENNELLDAVVVASQHMAAEVEKHGFSPSNTHVLPLFARSQISNRKERDQNHLLFVGQLVTGKGPDTLIHAMALLPENVILTIAGSGRCEPGYRQLAGELGISSRIHFAGRLTPEALSELYARASAIVVPSRFPEPFGLVGVEAARYGAPIVASGVGGMTEWLEDGVTGLSTGGAHAANDPSILAKTICRLLDDRSLADRLGENARRRYWERFTPDVHVDALFRLFNDLIAAKSNAAVMAH